jgi:anaerobic ribonucleoside-triphosphate reductase
MQEGHHEQASAINSFDSRNEERRTRRAEGIENDSTRRKLKRGHVRLTVFNYSDQKVISLLESEELPWPCTRTPAHSTQQRLKVVIDK